MDNMKKEDLIGQVEETTDTIDPWRVRAFGATLGLGDVSDAIGSDLPIGWHWGFFLPTVPRAGLGPDGHAARGGFLSSDTFARRMWAGGRVSVVQALRIGETATRRSTVLGVSEKEGKSSSLVFVTIRHDITGEEGAELSEEHDIVYRGPSKKPVVPKVAPTDAQWSEVVTLDPVLLFRYSALTFNSHRIHYDADYCRTVEGYPGLVVHGPLTATLLLHLAARKCPSARISDFSFRGISPLFVSEDITLAGKKTDTGATLWATNEAGGLALRAEVTFAHG